HFDLGNSILLRVPKSIYKPKVDEYLDNLTSPVIDSIKRSVDEVISKAKKDETTYQYLTWYLTIKYQTSKIMGMDEIYVHIVDTYFMTGEMDYWANETLKNNLKSTADKLRSSLIGMKAPDLILQDLDEKPQALSALENKYTIIYFYDHDCGHCKKETPVLKSTVDSLSYDIGVYSVSADSSMTKMKDYITKMGLENWVNTNGTKTYSVNYQNVYDAYTTPTIYVLNEEKEIIAKKISAKQIGEVITQYEARLED
ncbi:MAG: redoxin domain-containing protein, partial [Bacteroidota bacterium]